MTEREELADLAAQARRVGDATARPARPEQDEAPPVRAAVVDPARTGTAPLADRIGLVLAGGGAKGAYQVGVLRYLADIGVRLAALAGASVGALNAAVVAQESTIDSAVTRLTGLWEEVARAGAPEGRWSPDAEPDESTLRQAAELLPRLRGPIFRRGYLDQLISDHLDTTRLRAGVPLWVSAFPAAGEDIDLFGTGWLLDIVRSRLGARAEWLHINPLDPHDMHQAILASAALPVILPRRSVAGRTYRDGGLADNTPVEALVRHVHCDLIIVVHLQTGALWDHHRYPGRTILEVRPELPLRPGGALGPVTGMIDFSPSRMAALREAGYADARRGLEPVVAMLAAARRHRDAQARLLDTMARLTDAD